MAGAPSPSGSFDAIRELLLGDVVARIEALEQQVRRDLDAIAASTAQRVDDLETRLRTEVDGLTAKQSEALRALQVDLARHTGDGASAVASLREDLAGLTERIQRDVAEACSGTSQALGALEARVVGRHDLAAVLGALAEGLRRQDPDRGVDAAPDAVLPDEEARREP